MKLVKNKFRLLAFITAFLFFLFLLLGFLSGRKPIPGAKRYSDNHFNRNDVPLKANIPYTFECEFEDYVFFIDDFVFYKYPLPSTFTVISEKDIVWQFRQADKAMASFSYFWSRNFIVYENKYSDCILIFSFNTPSGKCSFKRYSKDQYDNLLKSNIIETKKKKHHKR